MLLEYIKGHFIMVFASSNLFSATISILLHFYCFFNPFIASNNSCCVSSSIHHFLQFLMLVVVFLLHLIIHRNVLLTCPISLLYLLPINFSVSKEVSYFFNWLPSFLPLSFFALQICHSNLLLVIFLYFFCVTLILFYFRLNSLF